MRYYGGVLSLVSVRFFLVTHNLGDGGTDRREILHDDTCVPDVSFPFRLLGEVLPGSPNPQFAHPKGVRRAGVRTPLS